MFNPLNDLFSKIAMQGGFVNAHSHLDRAWTVTANDFPQNIGADLKTKWQLVDSYKKQATEESYYKTITHALCKQREMGVRAALSFIDCDSVCEGKALKAALTAKEFAKKMGMDFLIANQTLKGIMDPKERYWFDYATEQTDIIGSLPGADYEFAAKHLALVCARAKALKKRAHVHIDQLNSQAEKETELLARTIIEYGIEGMVSGVHGISLAAHPVHYRKDVYKLAKDAGLSFIACPTAWLDSRRNEELVPTHNSVTPIDELLEAGIKVALGSDNIGDIYKPFSNGDLQVEIRVLLEATHWYHMEDLVKICTANGLAVLGIEPIS